MTFTRAKSSAKSLPTFTLKEVTPGNESTTLFKSAGSLSAGIVPFMATDVR